MKGIWKRAKAWCPSCDAQLVAIGTKCKNCGKRLIGSKLKKEQANNGK